MSSAIWKARPTAPARLMTQSAWVSSAAINGPHLADSRGSRHRLAISVNAINLVQRQGVCKFCSAAYPALVPRNHALCSLRPCPWTARDRRALPSIRVASRFRGQTFNYASVWQRHSPGQNRHAASPPFDMTVGPDHRRKSSSPFSGQDRHAQDHEREPSRSPWPPDAQCFSLQPRKSRPFPLPKGTQPACPPLNRYIACRWHWGPSAAPIQSSRCTLHLCCKT